MHINGTKASLAPEGKFIINTLKKAVADCPVHIHVLNFFFISVIWSWLLQNETFRNLYQTHEEFLKVLYSWLCTVFVSWLVCFARHHLEGNDIPLNKVFLISYIITKFSMKNLVVTASHILLSSLTVWRLTTHIWVVPAPLTSKRCILYIYSTNIGTEYFKHALYSPLFSLQNAVCFIMLTCLVPALFTFYI